MDGTSSAFSDWRPMHVRAAACLNKGLTSHCVSVALAPWGGSVRGSHEAKIKPANVTRVDLACMPLHEGVPQLNSPNGLHRG